MLPTITAARKTKRAHIECGAEGKEANEAPQQRVRGWNDGVLNYLDSSRILIVSHVMLLIWILVNSVSDSYEFHMDL